MLFFLHNVTSLRTEPKDDRVGIFGKTVPKDVAPGKENVAAPPSFGEGIAAIKRRKERAVSRLSPVEFSPENIP